MEDNALSAIRALKSQCSDMYWKLDEMEKSSAALKSRLRRMEAVNQELSDAIQ